MEEVGVEDLSEVQEVADPSVKITRYKFQTNVIAGRVPVIPIHKNRPLSQYHDRLTDKSYNKRTLVDVILKTVPIK